MDTKLEYLVYDFYFESMGRIHLSSPKNGFYFQKWLCIFIVLQFQRNHIKLEKYQSLLLCL
jgi:hypothetical protein